MYGAPQQQDPIVMMMQLLQQQGQQIQALSQQLAALQQPQYPPQNQAAYGYAPQNPPPMYQQQPGFPPQHQQPRLHPSAVRDMRGWQQPQQPTQQQVGGQLTGRAYASENEEDAISGMLGLDQPPGFEGYAPQQGGAAPSFPMPGQGGGGEPQMPANMRIVQNMMRAAQMRAGVGG